MISKAHYRSATLADGLTLPSGKGLGRQVVVLAAGVGLTIFLVMTWMNQPVPAPIPIPAPAQMEVLPTQAQAVPSTPRVAVVTSPAGRDSSPSAQSSLTRWARPPTSLWGKAAAPSPLILRRQSSPNGAA